MIQGWVSSVLCLTIVVSGCETEPEQHPLGPRAIGRHLVVGDVAGARLAVLALDRGEVADLRLVPLEARPVLVRVSGESRVTVLTERSLEMMDLERPLDTARFRLLGTLDALVVSDDGELALASGPDRLVRARMGGASSHVATLAIGANTLPRAEGFFPGSHQAIATTLEAVLIVDGDTGDIDALPIGDAPVPDRALPYLDGAGARRVIGLATSFTDSSLVALDPETSAAPLVHATPGDLDALVMVGDHVVAWGQGARAYVLDLAAPAAAPALVIVNDPIVDVVAIDDTHVAIATEGEIIRRDLASGVEDRAPITGPVLSLHAADGRLVVATDGLRDARLIVFLPGEAPVELAVPGATSAAVAVPGAASIAAVRLVTGGRAVLWDEGALDAAPLVVPGYFLHGYLDRRSDP